MEVSSRIKSEAGVGVSTGDWLMVRVQGKAQFHTGHTRKAVHGHRCGHATQEAILQPKPLIN